MPRLADPETIERELKKLSPEDRAEAERLLQEISDAFEENPLYGFHACAKDCGEAGCVPRPDQHEFVASKPPPMGVVAAFCGNRWGKTTALVGKALIETLPDEFVPVHLKDFRAMEKNGPTYGRLVGPGLTDWIEGTMLPTLRQWTPRGALLGGSFEKAWSKQLRRLRFDDGGFIELMSYDMDLDRFGGVKRHFVGYDEYPDEAIRTECRTRLMDFGGFEMFTVTPLEGIGWLYRKIWKRRDDPRIQVVRGSIHDNPHISQESVDAYLADYPDDDPERRAREFGDFMHFGGMVYPDWHKYLVDPPSPERIRGRDVVVGIDPGYRNAAFVWVCFDSENRALVFAEAFVEKGTVPDYVRAIRDTNARWGVKDPLYVMDPYHGHKHGMTDGQTVAEEFGRQGIFTCNPVVIDKDAIVYGGVHQIWRRMSEGALHVSKACTGLTMEAEEYRMEDRPDGVFQVVKENDHACDSLRYAISWRPWYVEHDEPTQENSGWVPGTAPAQSWFTGERQRAPMGSMS